MKTLTIWQPWASLIVHGVKRYETRSWETRYRGRLAIHAAKRWTTEQQNIARELAGRWSEVSDALCHPDTGELLPLPLGCVVVEVRLVMCHRVESIRGRLSPVERALGDYSDGRFAWEIEITRRRKPTPAVGKQGLWEWEWSP
jgi:hypothetical protein